MELIWGWLLGLKERELRFEGDVEDFDGIVGIGGTVGASFDVVFLTGGLARSSMFCWVSGGVSFASSACFRKLL